MRCVITNQENIEKIATIFHHVKNLTNELNIDLNSNGLSFQALGTNHVCLIEMNINKDWFDEFECSNSHCIGIQCEVFYSILSCLEKNNRLELLYKEDQDTLNINISSENVIKHFEMKLLNIESSYLDIPEKEYSSDIQIDSKSFYDYINELSMFGDNISFVCDGKDDNNIVISTSGDSGKMELIIKEDYLNEYVIEDNTIIHVNYGMEYVKKMINFVKLNKNVYIHISEDHPMKMSYILSEDNPGENYLNIYLAPKIED